MDPSIRINIFGERGRKLAILFRVCGSTPTQRAERRDPAGSDRREMKVIGAGYLALVTEAQSNAERIKVYTYYWPLRLRGFTCDPLILLCHLSPKFFGQGKKFTDTAELKPQYVHRECNVWTLRRSVFLTTRGAAAL